MTREKEADNGCSMQKCPISAFTFKSCNLSEDECEYYTSPLKRLNYNSGKKWIVHVPDEDDVIATDLCIIVEIHDKSRPYYSIRYITEDGICHIGWSSYKLEIVLEYLDEYFEESEVEKCR